ncbi:MAG: hypothetical protein WCF85_06195 [Rhodospirillaceae bacterium]
MSEIAAIYDLPGFMRHLEPWAFALIFGLLTAVQIGLGGWILAKAGRSPLWILTLLVPAPLNALAIWLFAYASWPAESLPRPTGDVESSAG